MFNYIPGYILYLTAIIASALVSAYSVRKILLITRSRKIYDLPDDTRKIHGGGIPSLGGIGIFIGYIMIATFFWPGRPMFANYIIPSTILLFFTGIYDDLMNMRPYKKLVAQLLASAITVYFADIRIVSLNGIFGIGELPYLTSCFLTTLGCTLFINAFNFIDGIDGLACVMALLYTMIPGVLFGFMHVDGVAWVCFSLAGATLGLLFYNIAPAKIYMGDTGSMLLGFTIFVLSVLFIKEYGTHSSELPMIHSPQAAMMITFSILFMPVYDALRVFILRASRGISPFKADRTHLHYYLLDAGFTHSQSVLIIFTINILIIAAAYLMQDLNPVVTLSGMVLLASMALLVIYILRQKHLAKATPLPRNIPGKGAGAQSAI